MDERQAIAQLRDVLANLYSDPASIRRIVFDASLYEAHLALSNRAMDSWHAILQEAQKRRRVEQIISLALNEYPENLELQEAQEDYKNARKGRLAEPKSEIKEQADREWNTLPGKFPVTSTGGVVVLVMVLIAFLLYRIDGQIQAQKATPISTPMATVAVIPTASSMPTPTFSSTPQIVTSVATQTLELKELKAELEDVSTKLADITTTLNTLVTQNNAKDDTNAQLLGLMEQLVNQYAPNDANLTAIFLDPTLSDEDKVLLANVSIISKMDEDIAEQRELFNELTSSPSIDIETMKLKRMIDKRGQMFDELRQIIDKYNDTAQNIIDSMGR